MQNAPLVPTTSEYVSSRLWTDFKLFKISALARSRVFLVDRSAFNDYHRASSWQFSRQFQALLMSDRNTQQRQTGTAAI